VNRSAPATAPRDAALEVHGISRRFGQLVAVDDVSFRVEPGEICGFIGPNGAGKTTTMRICATLDLPDCGDVTVGGVSVLEEPRAARRLLGFMPDSYGAYSNTTVTDYLDFFARAYGLRGDERRRTLGFVTEFTSLAPMAEKEISSLSKGMRQRLCLAKTLLHDPALLILDEPAAGLDPRARVELRELLRALADMRKSILISSHILTELSEMCHSVAVIEQGRLVGVGSIRDVRKLVSPHHRVWLRTLAPAERTLRVLAERPHVLAPRPEGEGFSFEVEGDREELAGVLAGLVEAGLQPVEFAVKESNLEDVFMSLTAGKVQ
jgi:ABC-2 type transport system ATP-binding protein